MRPRHYVRPHGDMVLGVLKLFLVLVLASSLHGTGAFAEDSPAKVRLAYQFQPNQSLHFEFSQELTMHSRKAMLQDKIASQTSLQKHLRVISVDADGRALLEPVIDRAKLLSRENNGAETKFDTADGEEKCPAMFRAVQSVVGKPQVRVLFSRDGRVVKATGLNGGSASAQGLESDVSLNFLIVLPDQPVAVGDTWQEEFEVFVQLTNMLKKPVTLRREYQLTKLDGREAVIDMRTAALTPLNDPSWELQILPRLVNGTIVFDHSAGRILSREQRVDRQVINALGQGSLVHLVTTQSEKAIDNPKLARREDQ